MASSSKQKQGYAAEENAKIHLEQQGLRLIDRNFRCRQGEIDLIMQDKKSTVFVEVRYRRNNMFGSGAETVDHRKQAKLIATAHHYLQQNPKLAQHAARFDVISISDGDGIEWIQDAFQAS